MGWSFVKSNKCAAPVCEERAELKDKGFYSLVCLQSNPHSWSGDLGSDRQNEIKIQVSEMAFLWRVSGL